MEKEKWTRREVLGLIATFLMIGIFYICGLTWYATCFYGYRLF